jgi:hypothetical protein
MHQEAAMKPVLAISSFNGCGFMAIAPFFQARDLDGSSPRGMAHDVASHFRATYSLFSELVCACAA